MSNSTWTSPHYKLRSSIRDLELVGHGTRLRRKGAHDMAGAADQEGSPWVQDGAYERRDSSAFSGFGKSPPPAQTGAPSAFRARAASNHSNAAGSSAPGSRRPSSPTAGLGGPTASEQPLVQFELRWFPRELKPGCERTEGGYGFGGVGELIESEWAGRIEVAPIEICYHHRWASRLMGYLLDPWEVG